MQSAPHPESEAKRLTELLSFDVLDTEAEALFDELTLLASEICQTPIALISLVDQDRQWFKSNHGLDASETPRNVSFCAHAILQHDVMEVRDTHSDQRFFDNPLVTEEPHIRFYAGSPLVTSGGEAIGTVCVISDRPKTLTIEQKKALKSISKTIVAHLELRRKNQELRRTSQIQSDFLSYVSHEIRTQLNGISTLSGLLEQEARDLHLPASFADALSHVRMSGERLTNIVNSVLDIKQIEAGKLKLYPRQVPVRDFFSHIFSLMATRASAVSVTFDSHIAEDVPDVLEMDDTKLGQVALNLIGNAIKFTPPKRAVRVNVSYQTPHLVICVNDEGIGISEEDQTRLFGAYARMDNAQSFAGTGLGLMISRQLVELMGGDIQVDSAVNQGTRMTATVLAQPVTAGTLVTQQPQVPLRPLSEDADPVILVVEDNDINQVVIKALFDSAGLPIVIKDSGEDALAWLKDHIPDLVLMDLHLPGISGRETTRQLHALHPDVPVVALTADSFHDAGDLKKDGMCDILTKPVDRAALVTLLQHYLGQ
ncbi:hybrid sensor histidine kinase/response regulator [Alteromonas sp. CYL-A6]|uniref:hybrid sensor histidine kinase/response regulator n=1 Tax=Alteromonas nitratireducens TaxID=3390813 RepID=UPI0034BFDD5B